MTQYSDTIMKDLCRKASTDVEDVAKRTMLLCQTPLGQLQIMSAVAMHINRSLVLSIMHNGNLSQKDAITFFKVMLDDALDKTLE